MPRRNLFKRADSWEFGHENAAQEHPLDAPKKRRAATTVALAALFFAGAAFTAVAGDKFAHLSPSENAAVDTSTDATTTDAAAPAATTADPTAAAAGPTAAAPDGTAAATDTTTTDAGAPAATAADPTAAAADPSATDPSALNSPAASAPASTTGSSPQTGAASGPGPAKAPKAKPQRIPLHSLLFPQARPDRGKPAPAEIEGPSQYATVWLNSPLGDPTPPALRLSATFARHLQQASQTAGIDWSLELGILRAKGLAGHTPANAVALSRLADRLSLLAKANTGQWATALAYDGSPSFADKTQALARYDRAVGLNALVHGLEAAKPMIAQRLLQDPTVAIYPGGRNDIANGKVDVRVLAVISYLHESFGQVTVTSLISGHRLFARPGVVSAHVYGRAVDIGGLGGTSIMGHQQPGGLTEQALRDILLLPDELMPKQVISLLGLGGPSFPLADHYNHIHIGF